MRLPFTLRHAGGLLQLTLDTPDSPVNIFDSRAAEQVLDVLARLDRKQTRAVVFRSSKPDSFINGARLLSLYSVREQHDAQRLTDPIRAAYQAVRECPVPTVAAVRGNCYGCGMEFTLHCDYRIAATSFDTHFYLTEIHDYLALPAFGATRYLPSLVGLQNAVDLLLWGERWSAQQALEGGLVQAIASPRGLDAAVERLLAHAQTDPPQRQTTAEEITAVQLQTGARIQALPPDYHGLYLDALDMLCRSALNPHGTTADLAEERIGQHAAAPPAKAAVSYFFVRQMAHQVCERDATGRRASLRFDHPGPQLGRLLDDIRSRPLKDVTVDKPASAKWPEIVLSDANVALQPDLAAPMLYGPLYPALGLFEINEAKAPAAGLLYRTLHRLGFRVFRSHGGIINALLQAWLLPLARYIRKGGRADNVEATLRQFGFAKSAATLLGSVDAAHWCGPDVLLADVEALRAGHFAGGEVDSTLTNDLVLSLSGAAWSILQQRSVAHASIVDVVARELLGFPLHLGSICSYATRPRVEGLRGNSRVEWPGVAGYLASSRSFY